MKLKHLLKKYGHKAVALVMAAIMTIGVVGTSVSSVSAAFPSAKAGKSAAMTWSNRVFSSHLRMLGTNCIERISLKSGNDERAAFCLSPGKALNNGSTYKSSELNAGYAKKYYAAALAYYYKDGHNTGNDRYTYRAITQMFIWRIAKYKESTSKDFTAKQLNVSSFESCVKNTLSTMKSAGKVTLSKSTQNYYDEAVKEIFTAGEKKTYNNDVSFVKWSDGAGQILLTGKYSPQEDVFVNLKIKKSGIDSNGNKVENANLAGVEYRVYDAKGDRVKDKDGNPLSIKLNSEGEGNSSYIQLDNDEEKVVYVKEYKSTSGLSINSSNIEVRIKARDYKDGSKNTVTVPTSSTVDEVWYGNIDITKKGNDGAFIEGAVFRIYEWNGKKYVKTNDTIKTNSNGKATSKSYYYTKKNLGKFMIEEESVPAPYINQGWKKEISIKGVNKTYSYTVTNKKEIIGDVTVKKYDDTTLKPIDDAVFWLYKSNSVGGDFVKYKQIPYVGDGIYYLGGLPEGYYYVQEVNVGSGYKYLGYIDPAGAYRTEEISTMIPKNPNVKNPNGSPSAVFQVRDDIVIPNAGTLNGEAHFTFERTNEVIPCSLTAIKKDKDDGTLLKGFSFALYEHIDNPDTSLGEEEWELIQQGETNEQGKITFENLNVTKTYKVKEISGQEGYIIPNDNEQIINMYDQCGIDKSMITIKDWSPNQSVYQIEKYKYINSDTYNTDVIFENEKVKRPIRIHKVSSNRTGKESIALAGAEFSVYDASDLSEAEALDYLNFDITKHTPVDVVTTGTDGYAVTKELPFGKYILVETKVPRNMLKADNQIVEIDPNISLEDNVAVEGTDHENIDDSDIPADKVDTGIESDDGKYVNIEIIDAEFESRIQIVKKDKVTKETVKLAGTEFKIFDVTNNKYISQTYYETRKVLHDVDDVDENGNAIKKQVEVEEIINSYTTDTFKTDDNGIAKLPNVLACGEYYVEEVTPPKGYTLSNDKISFIIDETMEYEIDEKYLDPIVTVDFEDGIIKAQFTKSDIVTGSPVIGATMAVLDKDGKVIEQWVTTEEPHYIERIPVGEYVFREVLAPTEQGYVTANDVVFKITGTGDIQKVDMKDDYTKVQISKTDITGEKELVGATLKVVDESGKVVRSWVTNGQISQIERLPVGKYTLIEESAPFGYLIAASIDFEVKDTAEIQKVHMKDAQTRGKIELQKVDKDTGKPLKDVEFTIYDSKNKEVGKMVTDKDGKAISDYLPLSTKKDSVTTYTVKETKELEGYIKSDKGYKAEFRYKDDKTSIVTVDLGKITNKKMTLITAVKTGIQKNIIPIVIFLISAVSIIGIVIFRLQRKRRV